LEREIGRDDKMMDMRISPLDISDKWRFWISLAKLGDILLGI
jgi:hypothetical protein